jgi:hypothetical protein
MKPIAPQHRARVAHAFVLLLAATAAACSGAPDAETSATESAALSSPPPSVGPLPAEGVPETGLAVGKRFIYSVGSGAYRVYARSAGGAVNPTPVVAAGTPLANIFQPVITKLNLGTTFPASSKIQTCPASLATQINDPGVSPSASNPAPTGTLANVGCIATPYDSDVYYDLRRGVFWIMTHLRQRIWACTTSNGQPGYYSHADKYGTCHSATASELKQLLHRYIAVAVTKAPIDQDGDPALGFSTYVLVDEYGDWPQMMVHDNFLLLNTRDSGNLTNKRVWVFNANDLAYSTFTPDQTVLGAPSTMYDADGTSPGSQGALNETAVDWMNSTDRSVTTSTPIMFVKQQATDGVTYMVSSMGTKLVVYGLTQTLGSTGANLPVTPIEPAIVDLGGSGIPMNAVPPAWVNNQLYWAWTENDPKGRPYIRTFRVPVHHALHTWDGGHPVFASNRASDGYLEADIGLNDSGDGYQLPIINANINGDIVTEYSRYPVSGPLAASIRYAVIPNGQTTYSSSWLVDQGLGNAQNPGRGGVIDTASVVPDPLSASQIFMSDAYSDSSNGYTAVFTAVSP